MTTDPYAGPEGLTHHALRDIVDERFAQFDKFGHQDHTAETWLAIIVEEVGELAEAVLKVTRSDPENHGTHSDSVYTEARQVAASAVAFMEAMILQGDG